MAKLGISTGSAPNDGTGDSLLDGAVKVNKNFTEIYTTIGDGSTLAVPVTSIAAGSNISVSGATGNVTITGLANTSNVTTDNLVVTGVSTFQNEVVINGGFDLDMNGGGDLDLTSGSVIRMGTSNADNFDVFNNGSFSVIRDNAIGANGLLIDSVTKVAIQKSGTGNDSMAVFTVDGPVELYYDGAKKLETSGIGITITGDIDSTNLDTGTSYLTLGNSISPSSQFDIRWSPSTGASPAIRYKISNGISIYNRYNGGADLLEDVRFGTSETKFKNISPFTDSDYDLGTDSLRWSTVYSDQFVGDGVTVVGIVSATSFYGDGSDITDGKWTLGANGTSDYTFTGIGLTQTTNDPILYLARGRVYEFVNTMNAHPFEIRQSVGGSAYNSGVTNNAVSNGTLRFEIPFDAPNTLYYQCTSHAGMGSTIVVYPNTI